MPNIVYGGYGSFCFCSRSWRCAERSSCDEIVCGAFGSKITYSVYFRFFGFSVFVTEDIVLVTHDPTVYTEIRITVLLISDLKIGSLDKSKFIQPASTESSKIIQATNCSTSEERTYKV